MAVVTPPMFEGQARYAAPATVAKLVREGVRRRPGDRETGLWEAPRDDWYQQGDHYLYLRKGSRMRATFEFVAKGPNEHPRWKMVDCDPSAIVTPAPWYRRLWSWLQSRGRRLPRAIARRVA